MKRGHTPETYGDLGLDDGGIDDGMLRRRPRSYLIVKWRKMLFGANIIAQMHCIQLEAHLTSC